jgi:transcriptional regulator with XRE-family HTH domain
VVISKLEQGFHRPRIDTLRRIAEALGLTATDLLDASSQW